jgi:hypothetical protein
MLLREHPSPRSAEEVNAFEPELVAHGRNLVAEDVHAPLDVGGVIGLSAADLVVEDDGPCTPEPLERREVVVSGPGPAVEREDGVLRRVEVADEAMVRNAMKKGPPR